MRIVFATGNKGKLKEVREILGEGFEVLCPADLGLTEDVEETGSTLQENALIKAKYISERLGCNCFADDTGLEVDALNGAPGIYAARYSGGTPYDNMVKLLADIPQDASRKACFRAVIALILDGKEYFFEGRMEGRIAEEMKGEKGFGYDPVFIPEGSEESLAQMDIEAKNLISHRGKAVRAMAAFLKGLK